MGRSRIIARTVNRPSPCPVVRGHPWGHGREADNDGHQHPPADEREERQDLLRRGQVVHRPRLRRQLDVRLIHV
ncbi:hypothetical protein SFR_6314 [Streptomyces sp. FR-008]|nr:hypothetical protein SFR_6314 [Streptomyces sp. FR-008]